MFSLPPSTVHTIHSFTCLPEKSLRAPHRRCRWIIILVWRCLQTLSPPVCSGVFAVGSSGMSGSTLQNVFWLGDDALNMMDNNFQWRWKAFVCSTYSSKHLSFPRRRRVTGHHYEHGEAHTMGGNSEHLNPLLFITYCFRLFTLSFAKRYAKWLIAWSFGALRHAVSSATPSPPERIDRIDGISVSR